MRRTAVVVLGLLGVFGSDDARGGPAPVPSLRQLPTGNGHGFQVFDPQANAIVQFLERPYRHTRAHPQFPDGDGVLRRDLVYDTYFGVQAGAESAWLGSRTPSAYGYVDQTNMIRSAVTVAGLATETFYVAPFGYEGNALVMLLKVTNAGTAAVPVTAYALHNFRLGTAPNPDDPGTEGESIAWDSATGASTETGPGGGAFVYLPIGGATVASCATDVYQRVAGGAGLVPLAACSGTDRVQAFARDLGTLAPGASAWWGVAVLFDATADSAGARAAWTAFLAGRGAQALHGDLLAAFEAWRAPPPANLSADERAIWRQSEAVLRMAQIREPFRESPRRKGHGMILASLPPGIWHIGWVRDGLYATTALARAGHPDLAKASLAFFLDADAGRYPQFVREVAYRVSTVRYFGDGQEEADYSGAPSRNIEIDGWGLYLWAARAYLEASGDDAWLSTSTRKGDTVYHAIREGVAEALAANLEPDGYPVADASIWEVHWHAREHFTYTASAVARGFCDMATIARRAGRADDVLRYRELARRATEAIAARFVDGNQVLGSSLERLERGTNYRDGATLETIGWSLVPRDGAIATATLAGLAGLATGVGGYKRVEGSSDRYDNDEWIMVDLRAASVFRGAGQAARADELLDTITARAAVNHHLLPELYNTHADAGPLGAYAGSMPMVGYGAGLYQLTLLERAGVTAPDDCGRSGPGVDPDAPPGDGLPEDPDDPAGCGCATGSRSSGSGALAIVAALALVVLRRARRGAGG